MDWIKKESSQPELAFTKRYKKFIVAGGFDVYRRMNTLMFPVYIPLVSTFFNRYLVRLPFFNLFGLNMFTFATPKPVPHESVAEKYSVSIVILPATKQAILKMLLPAFQNSASTRKSFLSREILPIIPGKRFSR
jgi:hypothetical protein